MRIGDFFKKNKKPSPGTGLYHLNTDELTNQYTDIINVRELGSWNELQKYNPGDRRELHDPTNTIDCLNYRQHWKYLVHMIRDPDKLNSRFLTTRFSDMIKDWDVVSTSLVSNEKSNAVVGYFGFILDVPYQNILSTNYKDIGFYNHIGAPIVNGIQVVTDKLALIKHINLKTNRLIQNPDYILSRTGDKDSHDKDVARLIKRFPGKDFPRHFYMRSSYNEIIIVSKRHLRIHPQKNISIPATGPVGVKGIYVINNDEYLSNRHYDIIRQIAILNNVPILYIRYDGPIMTAPDRNAEKIT